MNKVHGGGINKLPSVNQLVGQPAQHSSGSASSLGPMGKVPTAAEFTTVVPACGGPPCPAGPPVRDRVVVSWFCLTDLSVMLTWLLPRTWDAEQPPHATQWRNERGPLVPVHGLRITLHPSSTLQPRSQPGQVGRAADALFVLSSDVSCCCPLL